MDITAKDVMKLRQMTQAGMMDCKKALIEAEGDFQKAVDIIREKGKLVAAKRADRETSEGAVCVRKAEGKAILVCLGCETDFVSATPELKALAAEIADAAIAAFPADMDGLKAAKSIELIMDILCKAVEEGLREHPLQRKARFHRSLQQGSSRRGRKGCRHAGHFHEPCLRFRG